MGKIKKLKCYEDNDIMNMEKPLEKTIEDKCVMNGVIYLITCTINWKIYIGQTKFYKGNKLFGAVGRLKDHIDAAEREKRGCTALYNAIRKYGGENFVTQVLAICKINERDKLETDHIAKYNSTNKNIGYNISKGGQGVHAVFTTEEIRQKSSARLRENSDSELNILPYKVNDNLIGYQVIRTEKKMYTKRFASINKTPEENLELARAWLKKFKEGIIDKRKENGLPIGILQVKNNKDDIIGYRVYHNQKGIFYDKSFCYTTYSAEENLEYAKEYLECVIYGKDLKKPDYDTNMKNKTNITLPRGISFIKNSDKILDLMVSIWFIPLHMVTLGKV